MSDDDTPREPIACTLAADAFRERLAWIAELNRSALQNVRRDGARLILTYHPRARGAVSEMVRREQQCCAFLRFELDEGEQELVLAITAPEAASEAFDDLFGAFADLRPDDPPPGRAKLDLSPKVRR
jgi:hypothetical protein